MCSCKWEGEPKILPLRGLYFTDQILKLQFHHNFTKYCLKTCIMTTVMLTQWHFLHEEWMSMKRNNQMDHTATNFIFFFSKKWQPMASNLLTRIWNFKTTVKKFYSQRFMFKKTLLHQKNVTVVIPLAFLLTFCSVKSPFHWTICKIQYENMVPVWQLLT